jgi:anti-sigma regulatory factor (Ser/Thr protein kinase)
MFCRDACANIFSATEVDNIELAIVEAANNIVEHSYHGEDGNPVEITISRLKNCVEIKFYDLGDPFDPPVAPEPDFQMENLEKIPESGRGLFIINSIMDELSFNKESALNVITLKKYIFSEEKNEDPCPFIHNETVESVMSKKEMDIAVRMHNNIAPKTLPEVPGYKLYSRSESALAIGGDYVAVSQTDDESFWFFVCDAMGKGVSASFFTLLAHMVFQSVLYMKPESSPGKLLSLTNRIMAKDFDRFGMFLTALLGKVEINGNKLHYASAGHCPPIFYSKKKRLELLDTQDFMLGVDPDLDYRDYSIKFTKGMRLLAYTDGITDITDSAGEMIGVEPLMYACALEFKDKDIIDACDKIFSDALIAAGNYQQDDISIIGIEKL